MGLIMGTMQGLPVFTAVAPYLCPLTSAPSLCSGFCVYETWFPDWVTCGDLCSGTCVCALTGLCSSPISPCFAGHLPFGAGSYSEQTSNENKSPTSTDHDHAEERSRSATKPGSKAGLGR